MWGLISLHGYYFQAENRYKVKKKVNSIVFTDLHIKEGEEEKCIDIAKQIISLCKKHNCKYVKFAGDWFTSRRGQDLQSISASQRIFSMFEESGIMVDAIAGNHDKVDLDDTNNYLSQIALKHDSFIVHDSYNCIQNSNINYHFLPYFKESGEYPKELAKVKLQKGVNILITHIAISGVKNNDGSEVDNNISANNFSKFDLVIVGHYHNRQIFDNIHYIGSPFPRNFGEDNDKGACLIYEDGSIDYVNLEFDRYETVKVDCSEINDSTLSKLKKDNSNVRIVVEDEKSKVQSIDTSVFEKLGFAYKTKYTEDQREVEEISFEPMTSDKIKEEFSVFAKERQIGKRQTELGEHYLN